MNEKLENPKIPLKFLNRRPKVIHSESELNNFIKFTILEWSENDFTCPYAIQTFISQIIEPAQMKAYFSQCYNNIHSMREHINFIQCVNSHIWALFSCRPAVTFYDIFKLIDTLCTPVNRSTIGPLTKIPIVKAFIFNNVEVHSRTPEIRLSDLIFDCALFLNEKISSNKTKNDESIVNSASEKQFLHYLKNKYSVNDFNLLGVKITNFKALRDAAYAAKCESFHLLISKEKLIKLLRSDVKIAMKNVREKLSKTELFKFCNRSLEKVRKFADLPFQDSLKEIFQVFIEEDMKIFTKHQMSPEMMEKSADNVKIVMNLLRNSEIYGEIFQLAAIGGALTNCKEHITNNPSPHETFDQLVTANIDQWKSRIFIPLMNDINTFMQLISNGNPQFDELSNCHQKIIEKSSVISHLLIGFNKDNSAVNNFPQIHQSKLTLVNNLAECVRTIISRYSNVKCLENNKILAILNLDLFPQLYILLISILSKCQLIKWLPKDSQCNIERNGLNVRITDNLIQSIFKAKLIEFIQTKNINDGKFSFDVVAELEQEILDILHVRSWPLSMSFMEYFMGNRKEIDMIINSVGHSNLNEDLIDYRNEENSSCQCISIRPDFIKQLIAMTPNDIPLEIFLAHILPWSYGVALTNDSKKSISAIWNDQDFRQEHLLEDGIAPVIDMRMRRLPSVSMSTTITDPDLVMNAIGRIGLMENAAVQMKWNEVYQSCWGDIGGFVNGHSSLAAAHNIRLLISEIGVIRINATCQSALINAQINQLFNIDLSDKKFVSNVKILMGNILSLFIFECSSLQICYIIDQLVNQILPTSDKYSHLTQFSISVIDLSPPELIIDIISKLIYPLSNRICDPSEINKTLQSIFEMCHSSIIILLKIHFSSSNHPIIDIIRLVESNRMGSEIEGNVEESSGSAKVESIIASSTSESILSDTIEHQEESDHLIIDTNTEPIDDDNFDKRNVVEDIRCNEFGIGLVSNNNTAKKIMASFNNKMARLIEHLSKDLYANSCHFVLELIQNADDNLYNAQVRPKLDLVWKNNEDGGGLVLEVINNEKGFTESDLRSLCDIGASTKCENRTNKIGRKGIGFKSVFLVSDQPEIHSNGFHVRFERYRINEDKVKVSNNALVPFWCDSSLSSATATSNCHTLIRLPIISTLTNQIQQTVACQLKPHLLLFLRNLTRISIRSSLSSSSSSIEQFIELVQEECTVNYRVVQSHSGKKYCWFLQTKQIPILDVEMLKVSPRGLSLSELSIAIPLTFDNDQEFEDSPAFAFLPIRSYGFRFIINADFSIPASREDISNECQWNKWLIEQIPETFSECLLNFISRSHRSDNEQQNIIHIIKCIPLPGEVPTDSSFHILIPKIRAQLMKIAWLPDRYGMLHIPGQLIIETVDDNCLTQVLCNRLNLTLLHPTIANCSDDRVLRALNWLGCQTLSLEHLGKLLAALQPEDIINQNLMKSIIVAIYNGLERDLSIVTQNRLIAQLSSMKIWPVMCQSSLSAATDNDLVSINQSEIPIFLPPSHWTSSSQNIDSYSNLRLIISSSFILSFKSTSTTNKNFNIGISILQRLGVHDLNSSTMIDYAIIPHLSNKSPTRKWLISATQFLVDHCHPSQYVDRVIPLLSFATISYNSSGQSHRTITPHKEMYKVHLSSGMELMKNLLPLVHNHVDYIVLDEAYLECSIKPNQWREFFITVGVSETFYKLDVNDNVTVYPEIISLLDLNDKRVNIDLLRYLDINWAHLSSIKYQGLISDFSSRSSIPVCVSYDDLNQADQLLDLSLPMRLPSETLFLCSSDPNKIILPNSLLIHFPICPVMFSNNSLPRKLGMINQVNVDHILALLKRLFIEKSINFTGKQSTDFYNWIKHNLSNISLKNLICQFRSLLGGAMLVAVPQGEDTETCDLLICQSLYWTLPIVDASTNKHIFLQDQQVYEDLKQLISKSSHYDQGEYRSLVNVFPGLQELFVDIMGIREFPSVLEIWPTLENLLKLLSSERLKELNNAEIELVTDVYNLIRFLDQNDNGQHRLEILSLKLIPCFSGNYRAFVDNKKPVVIYSWKSYETVNAFQQHLFESDQGGNNWPIDFLSLSLMKRETINFYRHNETRWTVSQFISHYFNLPILEDEMCFNIDNRETFTASPDVKLMIFHLETIISQWFHRNVPREGAARSINMLSSLVSFCKSCENVSISVSLRNYDKIRYRYSDKIFIGALEGFSDMYELLLGGFDLEVQGLEALSCIMDGLISWILEGDRYNHLRERFRKFYRSLFDLIESSDHNHVSIFIRSHNLRINPSSIDYIFAVVNSVKDGELGLIEYDRNSNKPNSEPSSPIEISIRDNEPSNAIASPTTNSRQLKRKRISISVENVIPTKQTCLDSEDKLNSNVDNAEILTDIIVPNVEAQSQENNDQFEPISKRNESQSDWTHLGNINNTEISLKDGQNRKLKKKISQTNDSIINQKLTLITSTTDALSGGRHSPLSLRLKEQVNSQKDVRLSMSGLSSENMAYVSGRIGEQLAYQKLTGNQRLGEWEILRVDWVNQDKESRLPYDFKLSARRSDSSNSEIIYLEVKATTQPNKLQFDLSPQEVTAAWSFKEYYHLLLVFHSGSYPDVNTRFVHVPDILGQLQDNQCKLLLDVSALLSK